MPDFLKNITETSYFLLKNILEQPGCVPADFFFDDPTVDAYEILFEELVTNDKTAADFVNAVMNIGNSATAPAIAANTQN